MCFVRVTWVADPNCDLLRVALDRFSVAFLESRVVFLGSAVEHRRRVGCKGNQSSTRHENEGAKVPRRVSYAGIGNVRRAVVERQEVNLVRGAAAAHPHGLPALEGPLDADQFLLRECFGGTDILGRADEESGRSISVTAGSTHLLVVTIDVLGKARVHDGANLALIHTETE